MIGDRKCQGKNCSTHSKIKTLRKEGGDKEKTHYERRGVGFIKRGNGKGVY